MVIPKPDKTHKKCDSYRPISLLNSDIKIISEVLALRLVQYLPSIINADQCGFIQNRQAFHNVRWVLHILYEREGTKDSYVLSLDAEKVFSRVNGHICFKFSLGLGMAQSSVTGSRLHLTLLYLPYERGGCNCQICYGTTRQHN